MAVSAPFCDHRDFNNVNTQGVFVYAYHYDGAQTTNYYENCSHPWAGNLSPKTSIASIADGTSNTIMIGERPPDTNGGWGAWCPSRM